MWDKEHKNYTLVDEEDIEKLQKFYWHINSSGKYWEATNKTGKEGYPRHLMLHRYIMGVKDSNQIIDHVNRVPADNRKINLRICTPTKNSYNRSRIRGTSRKYKGVEKQSHSNTYRVRIGYKEKLIPVGVYQTEEIGALMYNHYAKCLYGEFACLNEVEGKCVKNIFMISGKARSGKNSFGEELRIELENRGYEVFECAFADMLKTLCARYYGYKGKDEEGRGILQRQGDKFRENNPNIFVNILIELIRGVYTQYDFVIITDLRFTNELYAMKKVFPNSISVRVTRDNYVTDLTEVQQNHPSETQLDNEVFDFYVDNNKDIIDLRTQAQKLLSLAFSPYFVEKLDIWESDIYRHC